MHEPVVIRETSAEDLPAIMAVLGDAFDRRDEAELVMALLQDTSAEPRLSLLAMDGDTPLGYVLFTRAPVAGAPVKASLLAPLAVTKTAQGQGIGGRLIREGLARLARAGIRLVFVLGYPDYYSRHGFTPAIPAGFTAPYPIPAQHTDAWMVQALQDNLPGSVCAQVGCADSLDRPEYWIE
jgi:putative acetyltransferase